MNKERKKKRTDRKAAGVLAILLCLIVLCGFTKPDAASEGPENAEQFISEQNTGEMESETAGTMEQCFEEVTEVEENTEPASEATAADKDIMPEDDTPEKTISTIEASTVDGVKVTVSGKFPADAKLELSGVSEETKSEILHQLGTESPVFVLDISITDANGGKWQPDELGAEVHISGLPLSSNEKMEVVHIPDAGEPEQVEIRQNANEINFVAEGFSIYVGYTVDFHYGDYTYSLPGKSSVFLSEIFRELGIDKNAGDVTDLVFSKEGLVSAEKQNGDYLLTSLASFDTEELLTVKFDDGSYLQIKTTDPSYTTMYFDVDSSIPDVQEFEYYIEYIGLDFNYDIQTKQASTIPGSYGKIQKTITVAANTRIPIQIDNSSSGASYIYIKETPIQNVHTYIQLGSDDMFEGREVKVENIYYDQGAICFKHLNEASQGYITIKKETTGNAPDGQEYMFSVVRHVGSYRWAEETVTLTAGQTSVSIPYTHTTEYEAAPQIWIAELNVPADAAASFTVNGNAVSASVRELHYRFEQDVCNYNKEKLAQYQQLKWVVLDTTAKQQNISVVCTNAFPKTCDLTVSKAVTGVTDNTTSFPFELTVNNALGQPVNFFGKSLPQGVSLKAGTVNVLTFSLKNGGSVSISSLIPENAKVTLKETSHPNFTVSMNKSGETKDSDAWEFILSKSQTVTVTNNAVPVGSINVKKVVEGDTTAKNFPITLSITDTTGKIDFTDAAFYGRAEIPAGVTRTSVSKNKVTFSFSLADKASVTIGNLVPDGASVTITETDPGIYTPSIKVMESKQEGASRTFTVSGTGTTNVEVENKLSKAEVTISKTVTGNLGDLTKEFSFTVNYTDESGNVQTTTVKLKNGESKKLTVRAGSDITITEIGSEDYSTTYKVDDGESAKGKACEIKAVSKNTAVGFTNNKEAVPDMGIRLEIFPYIAAIVIALFGFTAMLLRRKSR